jgi:hypothetical protein
MTTGVDAQIFAAMMRHLHEMVLTPPLQIAYPNANFPGETGPEDEAGPDTYLAAFWLPNITQQLTMGTDPQKKRGLLQVDVVVRGGVGLVVPLEIASTIVEHFNGRRLHTDNGTAITIDREPYVSRPNPDGKRLRFPVTISWHAFAQEN